MSFFPDNCSAGYLLDEARSIIDRNIAGLEDRVRALKSRRNELSPISRLPVEILCNIFFLIDDNYGYPSLHPDPWTNFSRVSQHWRSSALSAPELWANIPLNHSRWAQEMLMRSKMAKLTIRPRYLFERSSIETFRSCLYEMNRVEEISIIVSGWTWEDIFHGLPPKSAPQLHTLSFQNYLTTTFSIPEDFLYDTDLLRHAELIDCKISWDSRLLTGLTHLTLIESLKANSSINQFLHALQRMPALTNLRLIDSIPDDTEGPSTYHPVVDLPCLRALTISSVIGALTPALRHITFPHSAILYLTCKENQSTQIDFSDLFSALVTKFLSSLVIRSLSLEILLLQGLKFSLWTQDWFFPVQPQLQLHLIWPSLHYIRVLTSAFDAMNLPFLTELHISTKNYIDSQTWVKTFGKLPILERVYARGNSTHSFLEALVYKSKTAEKSKTAYHDVSFPKLRYIHLIDTSFFEATSVDMLLDYLMERCERNAEVHALHLVECYYISSDDVERLKEIVVDVIWDGRCDEPSEEDRTQDSDGSDHL